jgi:hypothetical protein
MSESEITDEVVGEGAGKGTVEGHVPGGVDVAEVAEVAEVIEATEVIKVVEVPEIVEVPEAAEIAEVPTEVVPEVPAEAALEATEVLVPEPALVPTPAPFPSSELWLQPTPESALAFVEPKPRKKVKLPWRWIGAVVTMLAVGAGCAFAVMAPPRADLPGLKTAADGRYDFAPLVLPTLAPGQSDPGTSANAGEQHISDIRKLLLSPPKGAVVDHSLPGTTGWVSKSATLALLSNAQQLAVQMDSDGWRHTAATAWKTPDGAETKIWLVQFIDNSAASDAAGSFSFFDGGSTASPTTLTVPIDIQTTAQYVRVVKGSTATWYGQLQVDDAELLIEFTAPRSVGITPFEQEIDLQTEMLQ